MIGTSYKIGIHHKVTVSRSLPRTAWGRSIGSWVGCRVGNHGPRCIPGSFIPLRSNKWPVKQALHCLARLVPSDCGKVQSFGLVWRGSRRGRRVGKSAIRCPFPNLVVRGVTKSLLKGALSCRAGGKQRLVPLLRDTGVIGFICTNRTLYLHKSKTLKG